MVKDYTDEPFIEVTATPTTGPSTATKFPFSTNSATIAGSTVTTLVTGKVDNAIGLATAFLDHIKDKYQADEYDLVIRLTEKEKVDRGWFSHMDVGGGIDFEGGKWEAHIRGTPKKIIRTKESIIRVSMEKKEK